MQKYSKWLLTDRIQCSVEYCVVQVLVPVAFGTDKNNIIRTSPVTIPVWHGLCLTWLDSKSLSQKVDLHSPLNVKLSIHHSNLRGYILDRECWLATFHEEMLTLVELHRIQKKCNVKHNKIKRLGNWNFFALSKLILKYKIIKSRRRTPPEFQCVDNITIQKQATLRLLWTLHWGEKASGTELSNSLAKIKAISHVW